MSYNALSKAKGLDLIKVPSSPVEITKLAENLLKNEGNSLVVCGSNDIESQVIVNGINYLLGNYGTTIDLNSPLHLKKGKDSEMASLTEELNRGEISGLILYGVNPVYDYHDNLNFLSGLKKVELSVSIPNLKDETAEECMYLCPDHYALEA